MGFGPRYRVLLLYRGCHRWRGRFPQLNHNPKASSAAAELYLVGGGYQHDGARHKDTNAFS
jgi:hypothetical protein